MPHLESLILESSSWAFQSKKDPCTKRLQTSSSRITKCLNKSLNHLLTLPVRGCGGADTCGSSESFCYEVQNEQLMQYGTKMFLTALGYLKYVEVFRVLLHLGNGYATAVCNAQVHESIF